MTLLSPELKMLFDPYWRRKEKICGYQDAMGPPPQDPEDPWRCPYMDGTCPVGPDQVTKCDLGESAIMSLVTYWGKFRVMVGNEMFKQAHRDWRGGVETREKKELEEMIAAAWLLWQKGKASEAKLGPAPGLVTFTLLHWLVMTTLWTGAFTTDELLEMPILEEEYFEALAETDWGLEVFEDLGFKWREDG